VVKTQETANPPSFDQRADMPPLFRPYCQRPWFFSDANNSSDRLRPHTTNSRGIPPPNWTRMTESTSWPAYTIPPTNSATLAPRTPSCQMPHDGISGTTEFAGHAADKIRTLRLYKYAVFFVSSFVQISVNSRVFWILNSRPSEVYAPRCGMNLRLIGKTFNTNLGEARQINAKN